MNKKKLIVAHFSPTGGTKKVADAIASAFPMPIAEVDLTKENTAVILGESDILMAVVPVYAGRIPQIALERLSALKGKGQKAVAVVVYGNREFDDGLLETKNTLEANGFHVMAAAAFIAEHSIVRSIAAGRPDAEDEKIAHEFGKGVLAKLNGTASVQVPGNEPYVEPKPTPFHPSADETCVNCGMCAENCPVGAIPAEDCSSCNSELCINCLRCVQLCPLQCRSMPASFMAFITQMLNEKAAGYKKPSIFLPDSLI